jgi:hypothetical protein
MPVITDDTALRCITIGPAALALTMEYAYMLELRKLLVS